jgi:N6-adenosine-specific RNA methylase IME4
MAADPARDQARNLAELRGIAERLTAPGATRLEVEDRLRRDPDALTFMARLRRSGLSDAEVASAVFDHPPAEA